MGVEVEDEHRAGAGRKSFASSHDQPVEGAEAGPAAAPGVVQAAGKGAGQPCWSASSAAATTPPFEARTMGHSPGSHKNPCDSAR